MKKILLLAASVVVGLLVIGAAYLWLFFDANQLRPRLEVLAARADQTHRETPDTRVLVAAGPFNRASDGDVLEAIQEPLEHHRNLHAGQIGSQTEVGALPESQMGISCERRSTRQRRTRRNA